MKGDRGGARSDLRTFLRHYNTYKKMPKDSDATFESKSCGKVIGELCTFLFDNLCSCLKKDAQVDAVVDLGLGPEGYARPGSRGTLARLKRDMGERNGVKMGSPKMDPSKKGA